jgi:hypothetical protein
MSHTGPEKIVFVGDELTAIGFRLAGVETYVTDALGATAVLERARREAALVIVSAELAELVTRSADLAPALVLESARGETARPDFALAVRGELGIAP